MVSNPLPKMEVELKVLVDIIHDIKGLNPDKETDKTLEAMVKDLYYSHKQIVGSLKPFYDVIKSESNFKNDFARKRNDFRSEYTRAGKINPYKLQDIKMSCDRVSHQLDVLYQNSKRFLGFLKRDKLKKIVEQKELWIQKDILAKEYLRELFKYINQELTDAKSYTKLQQFLTNLQPYYDKMVQDLKDLENDYPQLKHQQ
jgi:hypothetical protein